MKNIFQAICAKTPDGEPCCDWIGENGAGHFVKMVHNGIEYGDMQLICEVYDLMKRGLGMTNQEMHDVFAEWNKGELDSYLIEITRDILAYKDEEGKEVVDLILDAAGQKGTGKWTVVAALDDGMPLTLIGEAVFARCLSAVKEERVAASQEIKPKVKTFTGDKAKFVNDLRAALLRVEDRQLRAGLPAHARRRQDVQMEPQLRRHRAGVAGRLHHPLGVPRDIKKAFKRNPDLVNLLLDKFFKKAVSSRQAGWRRVVVKAAQLGIPTPCLSSALAYFDGYRSDRLPANLLQA